MIQMLTEAVRLHSHDVNLKQLLAVAQNTLDAQRKEIASDLTRKGMTSEQRAWSMVGMELYPWTPSKLRTRDQEILSSVNTEMRACSNSLEIRSSPMAPECLGVFATRNIKSGEMILDSPCATGVSNSQTTGEYCYNCAAKLKASKTTAHACCPQMKFCSNECKTVADTNYHKSLCGKDFKHIDQAFRSPELPKAVAAKVTAVFLRLMAMCVQHGRSPLEHPFIASLTANYKSLFPTPWSFQGHIVEPIKILQKLGVNVFVADDFDTWVLQTVW